MYFTDLYEKGMKYSTIASARSALANVIYIPGVASIAEHSLVKRFFKGVYNLRPPEPKYTMIWDTSLVINHLATLNNELLPFKLIVYKLVMLLTLLSGQRISTLHKFCVDELQMRENDTTFYVSALLKHDRPSRPKEPFIYHSFPHNQQLCPVTLIKWYMQMETCTLNSDYVSVLASAFAPTLPGPVHNDSYHCSTSVIEGAGQAWLDSKCEFRKCAC